MIIKELFGITSFNISYIEMPLLTANHCFSLVFSNLHQSLCFTRQIYYHSCDPLTPCHSIVQFCSSIIKLTQNTRHKNAKLLKCYKFVKNISSEMLDELNNMFYWRLFDLNAFKSPKGNRFKFKTSFLFV
jgi:hypothetical protein